MISHFQARRSNHNRKKIKVCDRPSALIERANSTAIDNEKFYVEKRRNLNYRSTRAGTFVRMDFAEASDEPCARVKLKSTAGEGCRVSNLFYDRLDGYTDNESSLPCLRWQHEP